MSGPSGQSSSHDELDQYIQRLQNFASFPVFTIQAGDALVLWMNVTGQALVRRLVIDDHALRNDINVINAEIMHWGRIAATCKRVWQVRTRQYRVWRSALELEARSVPELLSHSAKGDAKPPSKDVIDAWVRTRPSYNEQYRLQEEAEEAFNAATVAYEAFKAKKQCLCSDVYKAGDGSLQRLSP